MHLSHPPDRRCIAVDARTATRAQHGQRIGHKSHARRIAGRASADPSHRLSRRRNPLARWRCPIVAASASRSRCPRAIRLLQAHRSQASPETLNLLPISNRRTRDCCRRRFSRQLCTRPGHSDTRISLKSAEIGLASLSAGVPGKELLLQSRIDKGVADHLAIAAIGHCRHAGDRSKPTTRSQCPRSAERSHAAPRFCRILSGAPPPR